MELVRERGVAREGGDFSRADALRDRIHELGWEVVDGPQGATTRRLDRVEHFANVARALDSTKSDELYEFSVCLAVSGWAEDVRRLHDSLARGDGSVELIAVNATAVALDFEALFGERSQLSAARALQLDEEAGFAQAWNVAAARARGRVLVFTDPSLSFGVEALAALGEALSDLEAGAVGPLGLTTDDIQEFRETDATYVDALQHLIAIRRSDLDRLGRFDPHFRFYRNLDIDFSYQVMRAGLAVKRVDCPGLERHAHRVWEGTPAEERDRLSHKNFHRFLQNRRN